MKYSINEVINYIKGNDLDGYNVEDLENDPIFMTSVVMASNDKNIYKLCSNKVKANYDFVKIMIKKFYYDTAFIDEVATTFLKTNKDDYETSGIVVLMCETLEELHNKELFAKYRTIFIAKFMTQMLEIEAYKKARPNDAKLIGKGFAIIYENYNYDQNILKYFAIEFIEYLFNESGVDLAGEIHKDFRTPNDIYDYGLMKYMINFLDKYDTNLADYAAVHPDILNKFIDRINRIQVRWNNYTAKEEALKYVEMFEKVHQFMGQQEFNTIIGEEAYIYHVGKSLGISAKLASYSGLDRATYEMLNGYITKDELETIMKNDIQERFIYVNIRRIMLETIFGEFESEHHEGKIIHVDFSKGI